MTRNYGDERRMRRILCVLALMLALDAIALWFFR